MAGIVVSTEYIELTFTNGVTSSASSNLSKGQAHANTVVWSVHAYDNGTDGSDDFTHRAFDAHVDDNAGTARLNVDRGGTSGDAIVRCFVVEFDSSAITVQKGTWSMAATNPTDTQSITAVSATTAAFMKFFWQTSGTGDDYADSLVRGRFNTTSQVAFERALTTGSISGHYQVIEADGGEFTVEHVTNAMGSTTEETTTTLTAVTALADAFLVVSHDGGDSADDPQGGALNTWMNSTTQATHHRSDGAATNNITIDINLAVVEAQNSEFTVQRVSDTAQTTAGDESEAITTVADTAFTTVHLNLAPSHSVAERDTSTGTENWPTMVGVELATSSTIEVASGTTSTKRYSAEIIEWVESTAGPAVAVVQPAKLALLGVGV